MAADDVLQNGFEPGARLVTGGDLNRIIEAVNKAFSEQISPDIIGQPDGIATLDDNGKVPAAQIPAPATFGAVDLTSAQSIDGVKTFSSNPQIPVPSDGPDAANKNYVDAQITIVDQGKVSVTSSTNSIYGTDGAGDAKIYPTNAVDGVVVADGTGKIPSSLLPPLDHDAAEANSEAAMLALVGIAAPAICIRTDFTPAHVFYLHTDPPSTLANWTDTGEFGGGAGNPSATVGLTAKNGVATAYMRADGAPALDQAIAPTWTGAHTFSQTMTTAAITASGLIQSSGGLAGNTTVTAGIGSNSVQMAGAPNGSDPSIKALGVTDANVSIEFQAKGTGLLKLASPTTVSGAFTATSTVAVTGNATFGGNVAVAGILGSAANTTLPSATNSGITLGGAPTWAMQSFYDQSLTANNRTADLLFISNSIKFRFVNDARNAFLDVLSINGGQALGVTGITSTSGSGSWTHTGSHTVVQPSDVYKVWVAKSTASDTQNAPTAIGAASTYLQIGGREWKVNGFGGIGFGYVTGNTVNPPVWIGWEEKVTSSFTNGDFLIATRPTNTNVAPTERFRITAAGDATFTNPVKTGGYTVATLPAASSALQGARAFVTDSAASPAFLATVAGGGTTVAPVFCNGTAWVYG